MRGNKHAFLGINIDIKYNRIQVDMVKHLEECIGMFGEDDSTLVTSQGNKKLSEVMEDAKQLSEKKR